MTTKLLSLAGFAMLLFSCSDDDATTVPISNNADAVFDYYTVESTSTQTATGSTSGFFVTANLQDEKFFSETRENFLNGVGQGQSTEQHYFYEDGLLVKRVYPGDIREFTYDAERRLIAIHWQFNDNHLYYRMVYQTDGRIYFERLTLPNDDPATTIAFRNVIELDANDNVVKAGRDTDLDGVANWYNTFGYNADGNLTSIFNYSSGTTTTIDYAPIKDNFAQLQINTHGKKNLMVYQAECYTNLIVDDMRQSPDLRMIDTQEALIETQGLPYYFRKTKTTTSADVENVTVTTFYFE